MQILKCQPPWQHHRSESHVNTAEFWPSSVQQETSFDAIGRRLLANPLRVRFHYDHLDVFDIIFHITRGGISKASQTINLSEDVFAGFNSTLRRGCISYHEYLCESKLDFKI
ncbi:Putative callose synthase 8 [Trifolium repens]|nr:Putative callose synthase 8 [Trifolium repens]